MTERDDSTSADKPSLADSPWFWLILFSAAGLAALVVVGPKYAQRQARIERQFQAREEIARRQQEGRTEPPAIDPEQSEPAESPPLMIRLEPLVLLMAGLFLCVVVVWLGLLWSKHRRTVSKQEPHDLAG